MAWFSCIFHFQLPIKRLRALLDSGKVYWTFVGFAFMPKYQPTIETKEKMIVPVVDISADTVLKLVAAWLKEQT
jgi:hypothetical protein